MKEDVRTIAILGAVLLGIMMILAAAQSIGMWFLGYALRTEQLPTIIRVVFGLAGCGLLIAFFYGAMNFIIVTFGMLLKVSSPKLFERYALWWQSRKNRLLQPAKRIVELL